MLNLILINLTLILILLFVFLFVIIPFINHCIKRHRSIKKTRSLPEGVKIHNLKAALKPSGFTYDPQNDIITSTLHPWQRDFGYEGLYDEGAPYFSMILETLPVYFNYQDRTWLIQLWKGQYGISAGSEIGVYHSDKIIPKKKRREAHFESVTDQELLFLSANLCHRRKPMFRIEKWHWWLTGFTVGEYIRADELVMEASITFPNREMLNAYVESLLDQNIPLHNIHIRRLTVTVYFSKPLCPISFSRTIRNWFICIFNRIYVTLFCFFTRPFRCTLDRLTYLLNYSPLLFRILTRQSHCKKRRRKR